MGVSFHKFFGPLSLTENANHTTRGDDICRRVQVELHSQVESDAEPLGKNSRRVKDSNTELHHRRLPASQYREPHE